MRILISKISEAVKAIGHTVWSDFRHFESEFREVLDC